MLDTSWTLSPLLALATAGVVAYSVAWKRAQVRHDSDVPGEARLWCAVGATILMIVAVWSPVARVAEQSVGVHMVQHLLLLDSIPILVVIAVTPGLLGAWEEPLRSLERRVFPLLHPVAVIAVYAGGIWLWNLRPLYELAVSGSGWRTLQHLWMLGSGLLFWWYVIGAVRPLRRPRGMAVFGFVTAAKLITGALATVILGTTLAEYPAYADAPRIADMTARDDALFAGAVMLFEELVAMSVALTVMFVRMLGESDEEDRLQDEAFDHVASDEPESRPTPGTKRPTRAA